jgi:hypothetical protein
MLPIWASQVGGRSRAEAVFAIKAVAPLGDRARLAAGLVDSVRPILATQPVLRRTGRNSTIASRNSREVVEAIDLLELLGPAAAAAVPDLIRRLTMPMISGGIDDELQKEFDAIWRVLPRADPDWMWRGETDKALTTWAEWEKRSEAAAERLQLRLARDCTKKLKEVREDRRKAKR